MSEHDDQTAFVQYVRIAYSARADFLPLLFFAVPNGVKLGGRNTAAMMQKLKAEGFTTGVADVLYLQPRGGYPFLAIELKTEKRRNEKNGGLSPDQQQWLQQARAAGGMVYVCYGFDEARDAFDEYMREDGIEA